MTPQYWIVQSYSIAEERFRIAAIFTGPDDASVFVKSLPVGELGAITHGPITLDVLCRLIVRHSLDDLLPNHWVKAMKQ